MNEGIANFLRTFSVGYPFLWALLVMAVVSFTSLALYFFWEVVLRPLSSRVSSDKNQSESVG